MGASQQVDVQPTHRSGFLFGGRLSLDLTWTVRYRAVMPTELLRTLEDVRGWLDQVALPCPPRLSPSDLAAIRDLREAIYRTAIAVIDGHVIRQSDRTLINRWAKQPSPFPVLAAAGEHRTAAPAGREMSAALSAIARDAITLFGDTVQGRLRRCSGPNCSLLFHDDSRPGTRRWCTTTRCGNRVNTKAYRQRQNAD